ncbi:MAG: beta-propeller domain-containing protein [Bradymonadaceae bacterium]
MNTSKKSRRWFFPVRYAAILAAISLLAACGDSEPPDGEGPKTGIIETAQPNPQIGQTSFVSADGHAGQTTQQNEERAGDASNNAAAAPDAEAGDEDRTVEEGDIYRVISGSDLLLNLNSFRGLQIIDLNDVANPEIIGRVAISGTPVEMYQVGDRVFILMNNWYGYYGSRDDIAAEQYRGGVVAAVDISDVRNPRITAQARVPGNIRTSRLTRGNGKEALFVVAAQNSTTYVKSFSVSGDGKLADAGELDLGGWVSDIQATPDRLLVARTNWNSGNNESEVSVIDITDPDGSMVEGQSVQVKGRIRTQFNMDMRGDMLRVVSGNSWSTSTNTNHLETFDASDIQDIKPLDHATFGNNEDLYATLFLEDSAFFVTYRRIDPFHAFEILPDGTVFERSEFVISGWNDYFRAVSNQTRLIGIGKNDENGRNTMAVSLYDITELSNPDPFITRKEIELDRSWSEAQWDHRAFSVLEKAVSVEAPTGELETGLVLLPFTGMDRDGDRYISAVQIFTFSNDTLTLRGTMEHGTPVRRSFVAHRDNATTANLSEAELTLFDTASPDNPVELGRLDLAPDYTEFMIFGNHGVRRQNRSQYYWWWGWGGGADTERVDTLEVIPMNDDPDAAPVLAEIDISARAQIYQVNDRLLILELQRRDDQPHRDQYEDLPVLDGFIQVWNLSNPSSPVLEGTLETDAIRGGQHYYYDYYDDSYYYGGYTPRPTAVSLDNSLVFVNTVPKRELQGTLHYEYTYAADRGSSSCWDHNYEPIACTYYSGNIFCSQLENLDGTRDSKVCYGTLQRCERDAQRQTECEPIDASSIRTETNTNSRQQFRYWNQFEFVPVDLTTGSPSIGETLVMGEEEEAVAALGRGDTLYFGYKVPTRVAGDSRPYVRFFYRALDLSSPSRPATSASINIPGKLIAVDGDVLVTQDVLWGQHIIETALNKVRVTNGRARLEGIHRFVDQNVAQISLDEAGHLLVSHRNAYRYNYYDYYEDAPSSGEEIDYGQKLSILDAREASFELVTTTDIDRWATLRAVEAGRALFSVPGGLLIINVEDPAQPYAQAYFAAQGWPRDIVLDGNDIVMAAGRHGLYRFDTNEFNLLQRD